MQTPNLKMMAVYGTLSWIFFLLAALQAFGFHHWITHTVVFLALPLPLVIGWFYIRAVKRQNAKEMENINKHWGWQDE